MKVIVSVLVLALVGVAAVFLYTNQTGGTPVSESAQAVSLCEEGSADLNAFRLNAARDKLLACLELDPDLAEASISLAYTYARLGREPEFKTTLARADSLVANISDPERRMMAQLRLADASDSRFYSIRDSLVNRLAKEKPKNVHVLVALTKRAKTPEEQEKAWQKVMDADPNYAVTYNMLGYLELHRANYDKAIEHMQKYAFLAPDLANPHDSLGDVYFATGRYEEAEEEYVKSVTMQPDFYVSLINLGKTYLARGQIDKGEDILDKVRAEVRGSKLEQKVDEEILMTMVTYDVEDALDELSARFIKDHPDNGNAAFFRAMRLAYMGKMNESQAVMDSALTVWRLSDAYKNYEEFRKNIDRSGKRYEALVADLADAPATRVRHWGGLVAMSSDVVIHDQWYDRWRLGQALLDNNQPQLALEQIAPVLDVNPRLINPLILAVDSYLALRQPEPARRTLEQAKRALAWADSDFPPVARAKELEKKVAELEGHS